MGTNCDGKTKLNKKNSANATTLHGKPRNLCSLAGIGGDSYRERFCNDIGDFEWKVGGGTYGCTYNDGDAETRFDGFGCCGAECPITGRGSNCTRRAYRGVPNICCFRDAACDGQNGIDKEIAEFDSSDKHGKSYKRRRSCPKDNRDLSNSTCRAVIQDVCTDLDPHNPNPQWRDNWLTKSTLTTTYGPASLNPEYATGGFDVGTAEFTPPKNPICLHSLYRNVYGVNPYGCNGVAPPTKETGIQVTPTADGMVWGRQLVKDVFQTYISEGGSLFIGEDETGDTQMNELLWGICSTIPGICTDSLKEVCATVTTEDIIKNPSLQKWCGCYMPDFEYSKYTNLYDINKECTPVCNQAGIIPLVNESGVQPLECKQSTCVIDDVSLDLYKSKVGSDGGNINFSQICGSCGGGDNTGHCACTMTGLSFIAVETAIPSINISQQCGSNSSCFYESTDISGKITTTPIPCDSPAGFDPNAAGANAEEAAQKEADRLRNGKIILFILAVILILGIIWFIFAPKMYEHDVTYLQNGIPVKPTVLRSIPPAQGPRSVSRSGRNVGSEKLRTITVPTNTAGPRSNFRSIEL
jgi:hypothetical protein